MNNVSVSAESVQRSTLMSVFVSSAAVVVLGLVSWLIFDVEVTRIINVVFSVAVGAAIVTGSLLVTRRYLHGAVQVVGCFVAVSALAVATYLLPN